MEKIELIHQLQSLAEANEKSNPIAASVIYTLCGLLYTNDEGILAAITQQINNFYLDKYNEQNN